MANLGKQSGIPAAITTGSGKKKTKAFVSIIGCSGQKHDGNIKAFLAPNPDAPPVPSVETAVSTACRAAPKRKESRRSDGPCASSAGGSSPALA